MAFTTPAKAEVAWAAGFIDGEGCFTGTESQQLTVVQSDIEPLERLQRIFGGVGWISSRVPGTLGAAPKPSWGWHVAKFEDFQQVLVFLWPYMCTPKREQARAATLRVRAYRLGRLVDGKIDKTRKLTAADATRIKARIRSGDAHRAIAVDYGCCRQNIDAIARGRSWRAA